MWTNTFFTGLIFAKASVYTTFIYFIKTAYVSNTPDICQSRYENVGTH